MANRRQKTKNNYDKLSTGKRQKTMRIEQVEDVKLSPDERIQYIIENGHLIEDNTFNGTLMKEMLVRQPTKLASKHGMLKKRNKHIKYLDTILMSELLIGQQTEIKPGGDNNNDTDLSDQNNSDSSKDKLIKTETKEHTTSALKKQNVNDNMTKYCIVSAEQRHLNETKKAKKQTQKKSNIKNGEVTESDNPVNKEQTDSTNEPKKVKCINKDSKLLAQRLEQMKKVRLTHGVSYYQCDHCQITFSSKDSLQRHMLIHLDINPYSCPHCPDRKFRQRGNWRRHIARAHPEAFKEMKYECKICKKPFVELDEFKLHQEKHAYEKLQRHTCVFCEKVFKQERQLAKHEKYHMVPCRYKCTMCPMSYDSRMKYTEHLKSHSLVQNYECQYCGKSYLRPSSIARHIRVNHGGMRMQCPVCNKLLKGHLSEHMRTHQNQRPHECDVCGQKFTQSTQLTVHKRLHTGDRPYPCRICKRPFSHSNALMLHIRRHTGEKPFECAMCPQTFSQLPHMKAHMQSIHNKTEFYKCNNCNTFFKLMTSLETHAEECGDASSIKKKGKDDALVSRMRFLLALLFTMIASKEKLTDLGFNKRLIDDILVDSVEAMGMQPCKNASRPPLPRLQTNALMLLRGTVPKHQMARFVNENKSTEEILELLTDDVNKK